MRSSLLLRDVANCGSSCNKAKHKVLVTLADVTLGKSVTLTDICYERNTKAEIVHIDAISCVVELTSSSPLPG
jgi:hypothetical protein